MLLAVTLPTMGGAGLSGTACYEEKHVKCKLKQTHLHEKVDGHQGYAIIKAVTACNENLTFSIHVLMLLFWDLNQFCFHLFIYFVTSMSFFYFCHHL